MTATIASAVDRGPLGWLEQLYAEIHDSSWVMPRDTLQVYERIEWHRPVPSADYSVTSRVLWANRGAKATEFAVETTAADDDGPLARALFVGRTSQRMQTTGHRALPTVPAWSGSKRVVEWVVSVDEVRAFAARTSTAYPMHLTATAARELGQRNMLVHGALLTMEVVRRERRTQAGVVESWFRRPVCAGSVISLDRTDADRTWVIRSLATQDVAAIVRFDNGRVS